jgi:Zn-dependent protease
MECQLCKKDVALPFKCPYCSGYFCPEHRLPENHACPEYWKALAPREEAPPSITEMPERRPYEYSFTYTPPRPTSRIFWFSPKELKHITIGALLVMGVGLSMFSIVKSNSLILVSLAFVLTLSFLLHELAHKLMAQRYGLWAEFRLTLSGALITVVSMLLPLFKIISPGAVMIAGHATKDTVGKTAFSGPLTNIVLSIIFIGATLNTSNTLFYTIAIFGAWINAFIAIFNLIPIGMMDGLKIFSWNKAIWLGAFAISLILGIFIYVYYMP